MRRVLLETAIKSKGFGVVARELQFILIVLIASLLVVF